MPATPYLDFDLLIEPTATGYRARVLSAPATPVSGEFTLPFSELELENFLLRIGRPRRHVRRMESARIEVTKEFGGKLFEAVFAGELRGCLRNSLDLAADQGAGLRIRLRLTDAPELADLPWEYLYDSNLNRFLVLSPNTPVVRYLDLPERILPLVVRPPLRILVMIATPHGYPPLDVEREWSNLQEALAELVPRGAVVLERTERATLSDLPRRLRRGEYHVFHFIGHGAFDERAQDGVLLLEDEAQNSRPVSGQELGWLLHGHRSLRLAVLNACEGARNSRSDPFAGTAQSLLQQGIPAVIAMQFEITDEAAITFGREFYSAIGDGLPVDAALIEARRSIFARGDDLEWGTPVLYMRTADGQIFDVADMPAKPAAPAARALEREEAATRQQLSDRYTQALADFYTERWDEAVAVLQEILNQDPNYPGALAKLAEALRQRDLASHLAAATQALATQDWADAEQHLQLLVALDPSYGDATQLLAETRHRREVADLYAEARRLHEAGSWQAVLKVFDRLATVDSTAADPENLRASAQEHLARQEQQRRLASLYGEALAALDAGRLNEALAAFEEVEQLQPGYRETSLLLARVRRELAPPQPARPTTLPEEIERAQPPTDQAGPPARPQDLPR